jgi:hypothetical protein
LLKIIVQSTWNDKHIPPTIAARVSRQTIIQLRHLLLHSSAAVPLTELSACDRPYTTRCLCYRRLSHLSVHQARLKCRLPGPVRPLASAINLCRLTALVSWFVVTCCLCGGRRYSVQPKICALDRKNSLLFRIRYYAYLLSIRMKFSVTLGDFMGNSEDCAVEIPCKMLDKPYFSYV